MSDIRFNRWLHGTGSGGVSQDSSGNIGIGTSVPRSSLDVEGFVRVLNGVNASGVITATSFSGSGANLTGVAATSNISTNAIVNSGVTTVAAGSAAAPSITPTGDSDTGIFFPSADTIAFAEGGVEAARIDSSGRFGVGITNPNETLHVGGDMRVGTGIGNGNTIHFSRTGQTDAARIACDVNSNLAFHTNAAERARIDSSGRLLVNTSSSIRDNKLEVLSTGNNHLSLVGGNQIAQFDLCRSSNSAGGAGLVASDNVIARIECLGNDGSAYRTAARIEGVVDGTPGSNDMPGRLVFSTTADGASSPTERMRIDSSGRVTTPYQPAFRAVDDGNFITLTAGSPAIFPNTSAYGGFNRSGHYSTSTGRFTAPVAGVYYFQASLGTSGWSSGNTTQDHFTLRVNNNAYVYAIKRENADTANSANGYFTDYGTFTVNLSANDYVTVVPQYTKNSFGNASYTWFEGFLLG